MAFTDLDVTAKDRRGAWDREYARPDPLWKGPPTGAPLPTSGRVLELGCGNGKTASALVKGGGEVVGLDFSRAGLMACHRSIRSENLHLVQGDAVQLPFADHSFDHVVALHVLGHLEAEERTMAVGEMARVLRMNGTVLVRVFSRNDMRCGAGRMVGVGTYERGTGIRCHFFTEEELRDLFGAFEMISMNEVKVPKRYDGRDLMRAEWTVVLSDRRQ